MPNAKPASTQSDALPPRLGALPRATLTTVPTNTPPPPPLRTASRRVPTPPPLPPSDVELLPDSDLVDDDEAESDTEPMTVSHPELGRARRPRRLALVSAVLVAVGAVGWLGIHAARGSASRNLAAQASVAAARAEPKSESPARLDHAQGNEAVANEPSALAAKPTNKKKPASHPNTSSGARQKSAAKHPAKKTGSAKKKSSAENSTKPRRANQ